MAQHTKVYFSLWFLTHEKADACGDAGLHLATSPSRECVASLGAMAEEERAGECLGGPWGSICHFLPGIGQTLIVTWSQLTAREAGIHLVYRKDYLVRIVSLPQLPTGVRQSDNVLCLYGYRGSRFSRGSFINMRSPTIGMSWDNHNSNNDVLKSYWISDTIPNVTPASSHWILTNALMVGIAIITSVVQVRKLWQEMVNDLPKVTWWIGGEAIFKPRMSGSKLGVLLFVCFKVKATESHQKSKLKVWVFTINSISWKKQISGQVCVGGDSIGNEEY